MVQVHITSRKTFVASLVNIYIKYTQHSSDLLAINSVSDISASRIGKLYANEHNRKKNKTRTT